ncbi:MAG TPA: class I SAM-dependent methyltransferase [Thermohalobaculum sp.]|nr:class I SAM-dependent methyltransferase [Thermohalobaculum sp.]
MSEPRHSVDGAYDLKTPEDSVRYYGEWAPDYDRDFAETLGYAAPQRVAEVMLAERRADDRPVLDVGAGTGLVAAALAQALGPDVPVDGIDISAEMLAVARDKGLYRALIEADLTRRLDIADGAYGALISSGTFTHGHVGPDVLPELLRILRPGGLSVFGINRAVYDAERFGSAFAVLVAEGRITPLRFEANRIYDREDHEHGQDVGLTAVFRKSG